MTTNRISRYDGTNWNPIYDSAASLSAVIAGVGGTNLPVTSTANTLTIAAGTGVTVAGAAGPNTVTLSIGQSVATTATPTFASITLNAATGAKLTMSGATSNWLEWNNIGVAAPAFTTRSGGTKLVLYPQVTASSVDYALGIESNALWSSVPSSAAGFKWYAATTAIATLSGTGALSATSFSSTATSVFSVNGASGDALRLVGTSPYMGFHNAGAAARTGYLQGVHGSDIRLVAETASPLLMLGGNTVQFRDSTLTVIRTTVDSSGLTVNSGALTVTAGNLTLTSGNVVVNSGTVATSGSITSGGGYIGTAQMTNGSFVLGAGFGPAFRTDSGGNWWHANWDAAAGLLRFYVDTTNVKNFTIQHPTDADRWLVHACVEGPTSDVFYRGQDQLVNGECVVYLPDYFESIAEISGRTVQLTSICNSVGVSTANLAASPVVDGSFTVSLCSGAVVEDQEFFWRVDAVRVGTSFPVEPLKSDVTIAGFGPYTYIS